MLLPMLVLFAAPIEITPQDDLWAALKSLQPGDELILHGGDYPVPGFVEFTLAGSEALPITVRNADGETPIIKGIPEQNTFNVSGAYFTIRGLEIDGGSHGVRLGSVAHATLEDLEIHNTADVGISCNRPDNVCDDLTIRHNHIHDTGMGGGPGEGMYLGCNDGACVMSNSLVEFNWVHDTATGEQGDGIEFKTGSYGTVLRHNVIYNTKYPGLTLYGTQGMPANVAEGNVIWSAQDNGIQTVGDVTLRNNLVFDVGASGIAAKASQGEVVANLNILHNTVIGAGDACLRGNNFDVGGAITIANNAFYCEGGTAIKLANGAGMAVLAGNAVVGGVEGAPGGTFDGVSVAAAFIDAAVKQVYPTGGSPLIDAGDPQFVVMDDFNCLPRGGTPDVGAYDVSTPLNPGWMVQGGFKSCAGDPPDTDSDSDTDATTDATTDPTDPSAGTGSDPSAGETASSDPGETSAGTADATGGDATAGDGGGLTGGDVPTDPGPTSAAGEGTAATAPVDTSTDDASDGCSCTTGSAPLSLLPLLVLLPRRRRR